MGFPFLFFFFFFILTDSQPTLSQITPSEAAAAAANSTLSALLTIKASLDPQGIVLASWSPNAADPCTASFEGIACDEYGQVLNISLQGKGLSGKIPPEIGQLKSLSGLYLHFNKLHGALPKEIADLTQLSDLYLNVNNLSGEIPPQLGNISSLQGKFLDFTCKDAIFIGLQICFLLGWGKMIEKLILKVTDNNVFTAFILIE